MIPLPREGQRCLIDHLIERSRSKESEDIGSDKA